MANYKGEERMWSLTWVNFDSQRRGVGWTFAFKNRQETPVLPHQQGKEYTAVYPRMYHLWQHVSETWMTTSLNKAHYEPK